MNVDVTFHHKGRHVTGMAARTTSRHWVRSAVLFMVIFLTSAILWSGPPFIFDPVILFLVLCAAIVGYIYLPD